MVGAAKVEEMCGRWLGKWRNLQLKWGAESWKPMAKRVQFQLVVISAWYPLKSRSLIQLNCPFFLALCRKSGVLYGTIMAISLGLIMTISGWAKVFNTFAWMVRRWWNYQSLLVQVGQHRAILLVGTPFVAHWPKHCHVARCIFLEKGPQGSCLVSVEW